MPKTRRTPRVLPSADGARVNIADIAALAGVSTSAVSYALNDRPGISDQTRSKILKIANDMNWRPNRAAQSLNTKQVGAFGIVTVEEPRAPLWATHFGSRFLSGLQNELQAADVLLALQQVHDQKAEIEVYRRWRGERRVDGIFLLNPEVRDRRPRVLEGLSLPAVVIGDMRGRRSHMPCVWTDDREATEIGVEYLASLGHQRIGRLTATTSRRIHLRLRDDAFLSATKAAGIDGVLVEMDQDHDEIAKEVRAAQAPMTALMIDDSGIAYDVLESLRVAGLQAPRDVSILTWERTGLTAPPWAALSSLDRDYENYGAIAARKLLAVLNAGDVSDVQGTHSTLTERGSTARSRTGKFGARTRIDE